MMAGGVRVRTLRVLWFVQLFEGKFWGGDWGNDEDDDDGETY
jgi:hypothetical protein